MAQAMHFLQSLRAFLIRPLVFVVVVIVVVSCARLFRPDQRLTFGYPFLVDLLVVSLLYALATTHAALAAIMWLQRKRWFPSERAMFRFIFVKLVFWLLAAIDFNFSGRGVSLEVVVLFVFMTLTTIDLDVKLFRRYVMGVDTRIISS